MTDTTAATALSWPTLPPICPVCRGSLPYPDDSQGHLSKRYQCGQLLWLIGEQWELAVDESCREASRLAVAQRQRAEDAERDYAALLEDYNAAAAWLGVLESGDDLEVAAKSLTDQLSDAIQRADALQAERAAAYVRADTEYAARVRLTEKYDELDAERDALAAQVERLTAALRGIQSMAEEELRTEELHLSTSMWQIEADARADLRPAVPDPNAPSLDDFTHWPFP